MKKNREILRLAIPNIVSNVSVPLLSTVDTALMGHLSALHLGAVGIGSMLFNFIYWNFGFLRMGTTGLTAQAYGANNKTGIATLFIRASQVALGLAAILLCLQIPLEWLSIKLFQVDVSQVDLLSTYFHIRIWAAPATLMSYVLLGWFFGMQNALYPLILTVVINVTNILLSYYLIIHLNMGIAGAAWGTVVAQYFGLFLALLLIYERYRSLFHQISWKVREGANELRHFFQVNINLFIRTLCLTLVFAFFYSESSAAGPLILAVNVILLQMVNWMSYGVDGFAYAAESLVGKYKGRGSKSDVNTIINYCLIWGLGFGVCFACLYALQGEEIFAIFTRDVEIISAGKKYLHYMIWFSLVGFLSYIWDGIYIGLTATKTMRDAMLISLLIFFALHFTMTDVLGAHGLWLALLFFLFVRGIIQSVYYYRYGWKIR